MKKSKGEIFTIIGIIVAAVAAIATVSYFVYRFMQKRALAKADCYEFDCGDCTSGDCENCPVIADIDEDTVEE